MIFKRTGPFLSLIKLLDLHHNKFSYGKFYLSVARVYVQKILMTSFFLVFVAITIYCNCKPLTNLMQVLKLFAKFPLFTCTDEGNFCFANIYVLPTSALGKK